jgi:ParB/RepB/Spo0J family partition protein
MTETKPEKKTTPSPKPEKEIVHPLTLKLSDIIFPEDWNREKIGNIRELTQSIKTQGLLVALIVCPHTTKSGKYILKDGRRRYAALKDLGTKEAKVSVDTSAKDDDTDFMESTIINSQRKDNTDYEKGLVYSKLVERGRKSTEIAQAFGEKEAYVSQRLSIFKLPTKWQNEVKKENLTATHARMFAPYFRDEDNSDIKIANQMLERILEGTLSTAEAQERLDKYVAKKEAKAAAKEEKPKGKVSKGSKKTAAAKKAGKEVVEITTAYTPEVQKMMTMIKTDKATEWLQYYESRLERTKSSHNRDILKKQIETAELFCGLQEEA